MGRLPRFAGRPTGTRRTPPGAQVSGVSDVSGFTLCPQTAAQTRQHLKQPTAIGKRARDGCVTKSLTLLTLLTLLTPARFSGLMAWVRRPLSPTSDTATHTPGSAMCQLCTCRRVGSGQRRAEANSCIATNSRTVLGRPLLPSPPTEKATPGPRSGQTIRPAPRST
jgi:hypothetical protein